MTRLFPEPRPPVAAGPPVFVLSHARTGSTLLRYVIDAHPAFCCPPEIALGRLCQRLAYTIGLTRPDRCSDGRPSDGDDVRRRVRAHVNEIMRACCAAKGKARWCEKSTNNLKHLDILDGVFADAQYICLHRNCLDVAASMLELCRHGYSRWYRNIVARSPDGLVAAMVDSWIEATQQCVEFEARRPASCLRVRYEDLVADQAAVAARLFAFLGVPFETEMLHEVFTAPHDRGPGDMKIQFTSRILKDRVGKGASLPLDQIAGERLLRVNALHAQLGYAAIAEGQLAQTVPLEAG